MPTCNDENGNKEKRATTDNMIKPTVKYYMSIWLNALFQQKNYFLKYLSFHWKPMIVPFL